MSRLDCTVNGVLRHLEATRAISLLDLLREELGLRGTKGACAEGECGACTVLVDGEAVCSCLVLAADAHGTTIVTIEGLATDGHLHPVQQALIDAGGVQCGFCTPGMVVEAMALLGEGRPLSEADIREGMAGNLCRCTGYGGILRAIGSIAPERP